MAISLHTAFVGSCRQILTGLDGLVSKAETHVRDNDLDDGELLQAKLADDMWDLPWHVRACWMHSAYALRQAAGGEFTPDFTELPMDWAAMHAMIADAQDTLSQVSEDELAQLAGRNVKFVLGGKPRFEGPAEEFLLSFNLPNFYFHATTFYDILRMKGVSLGKRDYLGALRLSQIEG